MRSILTYPWLKKPDTTQAGEKHLVGWDVNTVPYAILTLALSTFLFSGCSLVKAPHVADKPVYRVWPEPPAPPRLAYVQSVYEPADLGVRWNGRQRFSRWLFGTEPGQGKLIKPFGVALDETDNLCLTDTGSRVVCYFDRTRKTWQSWNKIGRIQLVSPVAVAKYQNRLFVADSGLGKVLAFDPQGKFLFELNHPLERPAGLVIANGKLYVADAGAHQVLAFDLHGNFLSAMGTRGTGPGELNYPTHLATDGQGRVLVTDSMNCRVQIFDTEGRYVQTIGSQGDSSGNLSRPKGVGVDSDRNVYVLDALFDNVQVFDQEGRFLLGVGGPGPGAGEFWMPAGLAIGRDNQIFVADTYNRRIQIFKYLHQP